MITMSFVFQLVISFDPVFTLQVLTALVELVAAGFIGYYEIKKAKNGI